jgi:Uma2 family endonuclease
MIHASTNSVNLSIPDAATKSLEGFRAWVYSEHFPNDGKYTYFQTEVLLDMAAERANSHSEVKSIIMGELFKLVQINDLGKLHGDGMWFTNDVADVSNEPDAMFVSWETLESGRLKLAKTKGANDGIEYQGSPDWVLEVVSDSSVVKDTEWLPKAYHAADIKEYWLVDARGDEISFILYVRRPESYVQQEADESGWLRSEVFNCEFRLERQRDRIGSWQYRLHRR